MASVRFYLRSSKTDTSLIMGRLYHSGTEFVFSTGYSVAPKSWNQKAQRVSAKERAADDINIYLLQRASEVLALHDKLKREGKLNNDNLKKEHEGKNAVPANLYEHIKQVLADVKQKEERKIADKKQKKRYMHIRYSKCAERLKEFAKKYYRRALNFEDIDLNFYNKYVDFLRAYPLAENSIGGEIKRLKRFLKLGEIQGINTSQIYKSSEFKATEKKVKHVTLSEEEIQKMHELELSGVSDKARDLFIIGCRTGLRVSDYGKCVGETVEKTSLICIDETDKTGEPVYIPLHWQVKEILAKHKGVPLLIADTLLNEQVKHLGYIAGFTQKVKDTRQGRNKPQGSGEYCKKYELITTHTARRSCATNMYLAGFDLYFIQGILGHKKIETTIRYLGVTRKLIAMKMVNNPYFSKSVTDAVTQK